MSKKSPPQRKAPKDMPEAEYQRFLETAREVEASEDEAEFEKALKKVTPK